MKQSCNKRTNIFLREKTRKEEEEEKHFNN
jgi:hypothetical protein